MILTCPECATSYFVDDSRISAAGRTVKCSNCGARWTAMPGGTEPPPKPAPAPRPAPPPPTQPAPVGEADELIVEGPLTTAPPPVRKAPAAKAEARGKVAILAGSAAAAAALIAAAIIFRAQVVQLVPATQSAYAGLGMPVSPLVIEKIHVDPAFQGGRPVLAVTGQLRNLRAEPALSPALRVSLLDRFGKPVATKVAHPIDAAVPGKAIRHFAISIVDPPANVRDLEVAFDTGKPGPGAKAPVSALPAAPPGPQPEDAKPLPPGSPDALPIHP